MRLGILLLFIAVPLIELALLIRLGQDIGFWATIGIVILTAIVGTSVLQRQGLHTIGRINKAMASGEPPIEPVVDGMFLLFAGAFLLTPGIITDAVGIALLIPPVRRLIARWGFKKLFRGGQIHVSTFGMDSADTTHGHRPKPGSHGRGAPRKNPFDDPSQADQSPLRETDGPIIEGDFKRMNDTDKARSGDPEKANTDTENAQKRPRRPNR